MELRQLRCLIAVAETLHFGRAARRLDMLPASLGRQIKLLEERLGSPLLIRTTRSVALTEAGAVFAEGARDIVERADRLERNFRATQRQQASVLRIGAIDSAAAGLMPVLLPKLRESNPNIDVQLLEDKGIRLLPRLLSGSLDLAIVRPPDILDPRLEMRPLFFETAVVALPAGHPLARRDQVSIAEIADAPLIVPDRRTRPSSHDLTMKLFVEAGFTAHVAQIAEEKQTIVSLVAAGVGLAIVPRWASRLGIDGVRFVTLALPGGQDRTRLALAAVWLRDARDSSRDAVLETLDRNLEMFAKSA